MKAGALDFIEKPISRDDLCACVTRALEQAQDVSKLSAWQEDAAAHVAGLTARQRQIMELVLAGHPSKNIAADLGISQRTVENHRASIMKKMGAKSVPALARLALAAEANGSSTCARNTPSYTRQWMFGHERPFAWITICALAPTWQRIISAVKRNVASWTSVMRKKFYC